MRSWSLRCALVATLALAGCDPATTRVEVSADLLAAAADTTEQARSSRFTMQVTSGFAGAGEYHLEVEGIALLDGSDLEATMNFVMPPGSGAAPVTPTEIRVVDGEGYVRGGIFGGSAAQWVHVAPTGGGMVGSSPTGVGTDPSGALEYLRSVGEVETVGTEDVRDVATTHYRTTTPLGPLMEEQLDGIAPSELGYSDEWVASLEDVDVEIEAWVAEDGLVRRLRSQMEMPGLPMGAGATTANLTLEVVMELYEFGVAVAVEAPPADQVVEMSEIEGGASGGDPGTSTGTSEPTVADELLVLLPRFPGVELRGTSASSGDGPATATVTFVLDRQGVDVESVASYYSATLPSGGWTVAPTDAGDRAATAFTISGHGFEGTLTVAPLRPAGVEIRVSVEAS